MPNSLLNDIRNYYAQEKQERVATGRALLPVIEKIQQAQNNVNTYKSLLDSQGLKPDATYSGFDVAPQIAAQTQINKANLQSDVSNLINTYGEDQVNQFNITNPFTYKKAEAELKTKAAIDQTTRLVKSYGLINNEKYAALKTGKASIKDLKDIEQQLSIDVEDHKQVSALNSIGSFRGKDYGHMAMLEYQKKVKPEMTVFEKQDLATQLESKYKDQMQTAHDNFVIAQSQSKKDTNYSLWDTLDKAGKKATDVVFKDQSGQDWTLPVQKKDKIWYVLVDGKWSTISYQNKNGLMEVGESVDPKPKTGDRPKVLGSTPPPPRDPRQAGDIIPVIKKNAAGVWTP